MQNSEAQTASGGPATKRERSKLTSFRVSNQPTVDQDQERFQSTSFDSASTEITPSEDLSYQEIESEEHLSCIQPTYTTSIQN